LKNYLYYSSIFAVFTEALLFHLGIDIKLFYFILAFNFLLLLIHGKVYINFKLTLFYTFLLANGALTIFLFGSNGLGTFVSQLAGIVFVSLYYFSFFVCFKEDVEEVFRTYTMMSFWIAVLGIIIMVYNLVVSHKWVPLESIMLEPAHYATVVVPAYYYALKSKAFPRYIFIILLLSVLLSGSSVGLLALCLSILLVPDRIRVFRLVLGSLYAVVFIFAVYMFYEPLRLRVDDTVKAVATDDFNGVNLSAYALVSNLYVARKSFEQHPIVGSGLGSHELSHEKYIYSIKGIEGFKDQIELNAKDAGSLALRVMSDLGLIGLFLVAYFLVMNYCGDRKHPQIMYISKALLLYFFCKLLREGHYFSPEMYFFVFAYAFLRRVKPAPEEHPSAAEVPAERII